MTTLGQITPDSGTYRLFPSRAVTVVQIEWHGSSSVTVIYRDDQGNLGNHRLFVTTSADSKSRRPVRLGPSMRKSLCDPSTESVPTESDDLG